MGGGRNPALTIDEVKKALDSIDQVTQTHAAIAASVADSCEGLSAHADQLSPPFLNLDEAAMDQNMRSVVA